ncbi:COG1361 S-layer family protein [Halopiger aswanensis]|uniref:Putative repeat protein (TIGR01451 family) n=1 Tax=Halopiger aswanensis TaxID=148449 RepID=A0A419WI50_9EURY|nr:COG1361 S-layer family protein [Halopiger aswanensis]RKD95115.1 putative repeat protein (TIGR01451 family) [Halopiger aswanensis]
MRSRSVLAAAIGLLVLSSSVGLAGVGLVQTVAGQQQGTATTTVAHGEPDLNLRVPNPIVQPGQTNEVTVQVTNRGEFERGTSDMRDAVTTARNVEIEAEADDTPFTVRSGTLSVGPVTAMKPGEAPLAIDVPADVDAGTYTIDVDVTYSYTYRESLTSNVYERTETDSMSIDLVVDDDARFEIVDVSTDAQIGDTGTLAATVKNIGDETATDIGVTLESLSSGVVFGETTQDTAHITELQANETATVVYDVSIQPDTSKRQYMLDGTVSFKTADGLQRVDKSPAAGVIPLAEQQFSVSDVESDLHVGEEGDIRGVVTNDGPTAAANVVVTVTDESRTVVPIERSVAVGTLESGESAPFRLPVDVSGEAEPINRTIDLGVQYRNTDFEQRLYEDLEIVTEVDEQRDQFLVNVTDREIAAGGEETIDVEVTNNLDQSVTDIEASLFADEPLDSSDDEAFVKELEPGETATMTFALSADEGATAKTHPISFDFRYDDESGTSKLSDTTRVAIDVVESEGGLPVSTIVIVGLTIVGSGAFIYQQRR